MDGAQKLFLSLISSYHIEDIKDAILYDLDLAETLKREAPDYINGFRELARPYNRDHRDEIRIALENIDATAKQFIEWLKAQRPDLAYEIENYQKFPTTATLGLKVVTKPGLNLESNIIESSQSDAKHIGLAWIGKNIKSLGDLLLQ